jgi:hypothetical protein
MPRVGVERGLSETTRRVGERANTSSAAASARASTPGRRRRERQSRAGVVLFLDESAGAVLRHATLTAVPAAGVSAEAAP